MSGIENIVYLLVRYRRLQGEILATEFNMSRYAPPSLFMRWVLGQALLCHSHTYLDGTQLTIR